MNLYLSWILSLVTDPGYLTDWSEWICDVTCGVGIHKRSRQCLSIYMIIVNCELSCDNQPLEEFDECDMGSRKCKSLKI